MGSGYRIIVIGVPFLIFGEMRFRRLIVSGYWQK